MSRPGPAVRGVAALAALELSLTLRRGENLLVTAVIPTAVLLFFGSVGILAVPGRAVDFLVPGAIALAVIATSLVSLGIATAYERQYGVLKRLGGSPLPGWGLFAAKALVVLVIEALQVGLLVGSAVVAFGWQPAAGWSPPLAVAAILLGTTAFAGLGLALAGRLRAEAVLALANGLFLAFLLLGGIVVPVDHLAEPLQLFARVLPAAPLSDVLRVALGGGGDAGPSVAVLAVWAGVSVTLAVRFFRWW